MHYFWKISDIFDCFLVSDKDLSVKFSNELSPEKISSGISVPSRIYLRTTSKPCNACAGQFEYLTIAHQYPTPHTWLFRHYSERQIVWDIFVFIIVLNDVVITSELTSIQFCNSTPSVPAGKSCSYWSHSVDHLFL